MGRGHDLLAVLPLVHGLALDLLRALLRAGRHHLVLERVEQPRHSGRHSERGGEGDTERAFSSLLAHPPPPGT
jgi:hypothetical protein